MNQGVFKNYNIQEDWDLYTIDKFEFNILEFCEEKDLLRKETEWLNKNNKVYNIMSPIIDIKNLLNDKDKIRFWSKVDIKSIEECWEWKAYRNSKGYGKFDVRLNGKTFAASSHRISFILSNPDYDCYHIICHKCDNPSCVNPKHLFAGSTADNMKDCRNKKRNPSVKLTWEDVRIIRYIYIQNIFVRPKNLVKIFVDLTQKSVKRHQIMEIARNNSWHDENYHPEIILQTISNDILELCKLNYSENMTRKLILNKYGATVGYKLVKRIKRENNIVTSCKGRQNYRH